MQVSRHESREQQILARLRNRPRLIGQHVTETIYCNVRAWGYARLGAAGDIPPTPFDDAALLRMLIGTGMGQVIEEGHVSQVETIAPDTEDVGTVDVLLRGRPCEIKVTYLSTRKDIQQQQHWLEQIGEYVWRATPRDKQPIGELWIVHLLGDHGAKQCPTHGRPVYDEGVKPLKEKHPDTGALRMICPECREFLQDGDRDTTIRCHRLEWTWDELDALHSMHAWRQQQLQDDIVSREYAIGNPPPIKWGYQPQFECKGCAIKEQIGCPGLDGIDDLEAQLEGSILELQEATA